MLSMAIFNYHWTKYLWPDKILLPSGRFWYKQAPKGLSASSEEWCQKSDYVVNGLPFCKHIVDDILIWAINKKEINQ